MLTHRHFSLILLVCLSCYLAYTEETYRLPKSIKPQKYKLDIVTHLNDEEGLRFTGKVWIKFTSNSDVNEIKLHSKNLTIRHNDVKLYLCEENSPKRTLVGVEKTEQLPENDYLVVHPTGLIEKDKLYELYIPFGAELNSGLLGYYKSSYVDKKSGQQKWLAVTQFEPIHARRAFPCFDEPEMKAKFEISLAHNKMYHSLSNMPLKSTEEFDGRSDWIWDHYEESVPMSTYLVAYTVNDFDSKEAMVKMTDDVVFKVWARPDAISQVDYAKLIGPKVLKFYEEYFDLKFPLPKMDMIAIPDFSAGAMENWGLVTYRETALLYQPNVSSASSQHRVGNIVAHELAHQWFGNLVTMKWWTDLWLNEGFATYVATLGVHYLHPGWNSLEEESVENTLNIFRFDALKSSHPVSVTIGHPSEITQIFDAISYEKGSSIIRMMHLFLGEDAFRFGVSNYLKKHKYENAEQDDLWSSLTEEAHHRNSLPKEVSVKQIMDSWTLQTGYPVISVIRDYEKHTADIYQTRYLSDTLLRSGNPNNCWWIPLSYTTQDELDFNATQPKEWLECNEDLPAVKTIHNMPSQDKWVLFNIQLSGLYKVKYDEKNWDLLIDHLMGKDFQQINTINRAQLIDDALDLAWTGDQDYSIALRIVEYLRQEREYIPWKSALDNLNAVNRMLKRTAQYGFFKAYMQKVLAPMYELMGGLDTDKKASDRLDAVKHKILIASWSCKFEVGDCVEKSKSLFTQWQQNKDAEVTNPIPLDLRSVVYCNAIKNGGEHEWNFLWDKYLKSNVGTEKTMILSSLACTREIWLLNRYLEWAHNATGGVRKQDVTIVFAAIARADIGFHLAKRFLFDKVNDIYVYLQPDTSRLSRFIRPLADQMTTEKELEELRAFVQEHNMLFEKASQGVRQSLETIEINTQWQNKNYNSISRYLKKFTI